jgi:VCBS repeat-containing protein
VTVTINGAEDAPVFDSSAVTAATEDVAYSYTITTSDVDVESVTITAPTLPAWLTLVDNGDGTATLSGTPSNAEVGNHNVVLNVSDGALSRNQNFTITVSNANDLPVIGGIDTGVVTEDQVDSTGKLTVAGALTVADPDIGESSFVAETIQGSFGAMTIDASGNWSYSADNSNAEIQALQAGPEEPPPEDEPPVDESPDEVEEEQGGTGEDPILEEITAIPQGTSPPVPEEDSSFAQPDEPESEPVNYGPVIDKQAPRMPEQPQPQALQAQNLSIDTLTLQVSDDEALNEEYELELLGRIDSMHLGMDDEAAQQNADDVNVQIFVGSTASLTVGIVSWVLRGGALLASFMSTVPLLNRFDPLPILKAREDEEDVEPDEDDDEKTQVREHARKVDNMFSGKGDSQQ